MPWVPRRFTGRDTRAYSALNPRWTEITDRLRELRPAERGLKPITYLHRTVYGMSHYDNGYENAGIFAGWGLDRRDPTADRRLVEFCLSLPLEMLLKDGERRPLARAALSDRLPPEVLDERRKGYQAADWHEGLTAARPAIRDMVEEFARDGLASSLLDIPTLRRWIEHWPEAEWEDRQVMARYRGALLNALSAGHFVLHASRSLPQSGSNR
jgi:asparagine synthase (glutamine-hydrolysing)